MDGIGVWLAVGAMVSWGVGDFFIQKCTRSIGIVKTLFYICLFGTFTLFPFAVRDLGAVWIDPRLLVLLVLAGTTMFFASLFNFQALKEGKIAIVEPIMGLELAVTVALSIVLLGERLSVVQQIVMGIVFVGIILAITTHRVQLHYHKRLFERGVVYAGLGAIGMALTNFVVGLSSQQSAPLLTMWAVNAVVTILLFVYLSVDGELWTLHRDLRRWPKEILFAAVVDTVAWVCYAYATTAMYISLTTTISESYIVVASILGMVVNREKLKRHQLVGVVLALSGIILLAGII